MKRCDLRVSALIGALLVCLAPVQAPAQMLTGTFTGNATDNRAIHHLDFVPDIVIVKVDNSDIGVMRTSTMVGDQAKPLSGATGLTADLVQSLDSTEAGGFTIGKNNMVNRSGADVYWAAFKATTGELAVGTYVGNNTAGRTVTGLGFQPALVIVMAQAAQSAVWRAGPSTVTSDFGTISTYSDAVTSLGADGFTLGKNATVNGSGTTYHYAAWKSVSAKFASSTYVGNDTNNRSVTGVGFQPEFLMIKDESSGPLLMKFGSSGASIDAAWEIDAAAATSEIKALGSDGFTVGKGKNNHTNRNSVTYTYAAFGRIAGPTEVALTSFTGAKEPGGAVQLNWKTGYETSNLGFHVYRDVGGVKTRITPSLIAGSGLLVGRHAIVNTEQTYSWRDESPPGGVVTYYLEDVDFRGTNTMHGPIAAIPSGGSSPSPNSPLLGSGGGSTSPIYNYFAGADPVPAPGAPEQARQQTLAGTAAVKLGIRSRGWYRVTQSQLIAAGLSPGVDPRTLQLFVDGAEQAIQVNGESDGSFGAGDSVEFYATGLDTQYSDTRTYWLAGGVQAGRRIATVEGTGAGGASATGFPLTVERKDRTIYFSALENGDTENWFGGLVYNGATTTLTVPVANRDTAGAAASLEVAIQGVTAEENVSPDHIVGVTLNGVSLGQVSFDGQARGMNTFSVPMSQLVNGTNTILLDALGGASDTTLVDSLRLTYSHTYAADADTLLFTATGGQAVTVTGFSSSALRVLDVTDPAAVQALTFSLGSQSDGYSLTVRVPGSGTHTLLALTDGALATPASVEPNAPSSWSTSGRSADYVVITASDFAASVAPLVAHRQSQGHTVAQIDVDDLYDEFSYGAKTPQALRDFLVRAKAAWTTPPQFVVLVGDATSDPRNYAGLGDADFVPTKMIDLATVSLSTASDDWFADANGDGLPELATIGRLSVRTPAQADAVVAKLLAYDGAASGGGSKQVVLVADENDNEYDFEGQVASLTPFLPSTYTAHTVRKGQLGTSAARTELFSRWSEGPLIVNYMGHGSTRVWSKTADLLTDTDMGTLGSGPRLPFVIAMNCLNGFFESTFAPEASLAEALQREPGAGAIAVWASSGSTSGIGQLAANLELFRQLFTGTAATLGEAVAAAKAATFDQDIRRTWVFFGDPAMVLPGLPQPAPPAPPAPPVTGPTGAPTPGPTGSAFGTHTGTDARTEPMTTVDLDRDGRGDVMLTDTSGLWFGALSDATGFHYRSETWPAGAQIVPLDFNGDGLMDLVLYDPTTGVYTQARNLGGATWALTTGQWSPGWLPRVGRFTTSGRDDLLLYDPTSGVWALGVTGPTGVFAFTTGQWSPGWTVEVADFSGDGLSDVLVYARPTGEWLLGRSTGTPGGFVFSGGTWSPDWNLQVGQFNGDARADLFFHQASSGTWVVGLSTGSGFAYTSGQWAADWNVHLADLSGDGRDDVFLYNPSTGAWATSVTTTPGLFQTTEGLWSPGWTVMTGDLDRDGRADVFVYNADLGLWFQCRTVTAGVFSYTGGLWSPNWTVVGRRR